MPILSLLSLCWYLIHLCTVLVLFTLPVLLWKYTNISSHPCTPATAEASLRLIRPEDGLVQMLASGETSAYADVPTEEVHLVQSLGVTAPIRRSFRANPLDPQKYMIPKMLPL